jgi:dynein heavy chain, axonemal
MIAQDKEIVKVILLLTGSIQGTKNQVGKFLARFEKYDKLCKDSITNSIKKFNSKKDGPTLQEYEDKLKEYTQIEEEIDQDQEQDKIGAM